MKKAEIYQTYLIDLLKKGDVDAKKVISVFCKKFQKTERTFWTHWKEAQETYSKLIQTIESKKDDIYTQTNIKAFEDGLKTKIEKQLHLQKQIDDIQSDIDRGIVEDYIVVGGKLQIVNKIMNAETKAMLRRTITNITSELNKMAGDYAPAKTETTITDTRPPSKITTPDGLIIEL